MKQKETFVKDVDTSRNVSNGTGPSGVIRYAEQGVPDVIVGLRPKTKLFRISSLAEPTIRFTRMSLFHAVSYFASPNYYTALFSLL
jgi:hypothetical protein